MTEQWRVATLTATSPAHLITYNIRARVTACGWVLRDPGQLISREDLLARFRFACVRCMRVALKGLG